MALATPVWAQKGKGSLAGRVLDSKTGEPLIGATVLVSGTTIGAQLDLEGKFSLSLEEGVYALDIRSIGYVPKRLEGIKIQSGRTELINTTLDPSVVEVNEVQVVANASKATDNSILDDQKANSAISSGISAEMLAKTPDRSMAESFRRISGTTVREGRFAIVRGLNERYNQGMVNGAVIPSTEADRKAFALDLFPTALIDRIVVNKTFTPDQPGDFAGGLVKITTLDIPYSNQVWLNVAGESHSITTFKTYKEGPTSRTDFLGFDDGTRALPRGIYGSTESNTNPGLQDKAAQSLPFNRTFAPGQVTATPNLYGQIFAARRGRLFGRDAGFVAGLNYFRTYQYTNFLNYFPLGSSKIDSATGRRKDIDYDSASQDRYKTLTSASAVLNMAIKPTPHSKLSFKNILVQNSNGTAFLGRNITVDDGGTRRSDRKSYVYFYEQNRLLTSQLGYEHYFGTDGGMVDVTAGYTNLNRSTPDYKRLIYNRSGATGPYQVAINTVAGTYTPLYTGLFFSDLKEDAYSGSANVTLPFKFSGLQNQFKAGGMYMKRERTFQGRNYLLSYGQSNPQAGEVLRDIFTQGPDSIMRDENFGGDLLYFKETTLRSDFYSTRIGLQAGYLMNETRFDQKGSRIIYGVRLENYQQSITSARKSSGLFTRDTVYLDWMPSISLQYAIRSDLFLRAAYFRTVNRPELRELSPFEFYDSFLNATVSGNDLLRRARIDNFDLKLEYYPSDGAVLSINPFYKRFYDPIEQTRLLNLAFPYYTYTNAYKATNAGVEVEVRSGLGFLEKAIGVGGLSNFTIFGNVSLINSLVQLGDTGVSSTFRRPLQGQSPYVLNGGITFAPKEKNFDLTFTANRIGPRIAFVGPSFNSSIWEKPRTILDFAATYKPGKWTFRFIAGDLLAQKLIQYISLDPNAGSNSGGISKIPNYKEGRDIPFYRFTNGRTLRLAIGYTF